MTRSAFWLGLSILSIGLLIYAGVAPSASAEIPSIEPSGQRADTTAMWVPGTGPSPRAEHDEVLLLSKDGTVPFAAASVTVRGFEGAPASSLQGLAWDRRTDSACTMGAPRWGIAVQGLSGTPYVAYLPCSDAEHTVANQEWAHDAFSADSVQQAIRRVGGSDSLAGTIRGLAIVFNEGPADGPGYAFLDNPSVNDLRWASSTDGATAMR